MGWVLLFLVGSIALGVAFNNWSEKVTRRLAERQVAAADPEGYRLAKEYQESQKPENKARAAALLDEQRREAKALLSAPLKAVEAPPIVLKPGETAYWVERCGYYEERSLRDLGIAGRGMLEVDTGPLVLTDKRIVFVGKNRSLELPFSKVVSIQQLDGSMQVNVANGKSRHLSTGNPRAEVLAVRLLAGITAASSNGSSGSAAPSNLVSINLTQSLNGPRDLIVQTVEHVAKLFQEEVDRSCVEFNEQIDSKSVDASTYLSTISSQFQTIADLLAEAEEAFVVAGSPHGSPNMLRRAYGDVLDRLVSVHRSLKGVDAPAMFAKSEATFQEYVRSFYAQIASWPAAVVGMAHEVKGDSYELHLSATCDVGPLEHAIASESTA